MRKDHQMIDSIKDVVNCKYATIDKNYQTNNNKRELIMTNRHNCMNRKDAVIASCPWSESEVIFGSTVIFKLNSFSR